MTMLPRSHMLLSNGHYVDLLRPLPGDIDTLVLAHHLSIINRYSGATIRPLSVAEHSLLVVEIMERELAVRDGAVLLAGLTHDGHEAPLQDDTTPKRAALQSLSPQAAVANEELRARWDRCIWIHYGIQTAARLGAPLIKQADLIALATERRDLLVEQETKWPAIEAAGIKPAAWIDLRSRDDFTWQDWRRAFADKVHDLQFAIRLRRHQLYGDAAPSPQP